MVVLNQIKFSVRVNQKLVSHKGLEESLKFSYSFNKLNPDFCHGGGENSLEPQCVTKRTGLSVGPPVRMQANPQIQNDSNEQHA